jgi:hypothetical protein
MTTDLEVAQLRERLSTTRFLAILHVLSVSSASLLLWKTYEWLRACMRTCVDVEMRLLVEVFIAVGNSALVTFPWFLTNFDLFCLL